MVDETLPHSWSRSVNRAPSGGSRSHRACKHCATSSRTRTSRWRTLSDLPAPLWERGAPNVPTVVQQRSTATVAPEPGPTERHQTSEQRMRLHQTLPPTVVVQVVSRGSQPVATNNGTDGPHHVRRSFARRDITYTLRHTVRPGFTSDRLSDLA